MNSAVDCRDRTAEFFSTVQLIQKTQQAAHNHAFGAGGSAPMDTSGSNGRPLPGRSSASGSSSGFHSEFDDRPEDALLGRSSASSSLAPPPQPKQQSQFTQAAQHIGRSIHLVTEKLEKLGKLARQRSLFNDPASEINELTYTIKTDLGTLHNELEVLHGWVVSQRDGSGAAAAGAPLSVHAARNSSAIVDHLKQQLMTTTRSFQEVLQVRTQALKEQHQRRKQFEAGGGSSSSGGGGGGGDSSSSAHTAGTTPVGNAAVRKRAGANPFDALMSQASAAASSSNPAAAAGRRGLPHGSVDLESTSHDDELTFPTSADSGFAGLQQSQQAAPLDQTDEYLSSRARAVEDIESTIVQLGQMYQRLVHIVGMQEEITLRIDANMDQALENMDAGHTQLLKYYDGISGGKWLILKIFAVLLAFLVFFMVFVA